jgi:hypothetical protein
MPSDAPVPECEAIASFQDHVHDLIDAEIDRQDEIHPQGYAADRDGVRFGLCTVEDELREAVQAWRDERRVDNWLATEEELTQALAVGARLLRSLVKARSDALSTTRADGHHKFCSTAGGDPNECSCLPRESSRKGVNDG